MEPNFRDLDYSRRRLSASSEERTIFYIDQMSPPVDAAAAAESRHFQQQPLQPDVTLPPRQQRRRNSSVSSQCGPGHVPGAGRPRRQRRPSEFALEGSARRSSTCHLGGGRPRANSCVRPTPLGDGRRASVCKKPHGGGNRGSHRRPSTAHRRDSIRPARSEPSSGLVTPTSAEAAPSFKLKEDPLEELRARRHRRIVCVLLATFCFILCASVLAVVVTLTHSSFHKPPVGSRELAEHRANEEVNPANTTLLRKENEELLNSLNRDSSQPVNTTSPPPA